MSNAGTAYVTLKPDFSQLNRELAQKMGPIANQFGGRFGKALGPVMAQQTKHLRTFTTGAKYAAVGGAGLAVVVGRDLVQAGMKFEKQMDTNAAVSEANRKQMAALESQAIRLGKATFFSANEAGEAQAELVKGGLKIQQVLGGGLPAALNLAEAGSLDLAVAAETTVNAMKLFELEGKEAGGVADMLSTAANRTTADVLDFAMALKQGGSVTKLAGYEMNETVTVLEALAEAGIKNSDAGTSMKAAVIQLLKPTEKQEKLAKLLGIHWETQNGELKTAAGLSRELRIGTEGMTKAERAKTLATLAGTDGVRTLNALYAATPKELRALERANRQQGTAQEIARKKMDNVAGSIEQFKGSIETAEIQIYKGMAPALGTLTDEATEAANEIGAIFEDPNLSGSEKVEAALAELSDQVGEMWDRHDVTDRLVDLMEAAIPILAEHAGEMGLEFAEGFARGFMHADFLGKAVMATWLLHFIGGKAPFISLGKTMGRQFGFSFATEAAASAATASAASRVAAAATGVSPGAPYPLPASKAPYGSAAVRQAQMNAHGAAFGSTGLFGAGLEIPNIEREMAARGKAGGKSFWRSWSSDIRSRLPQIQKTTAVMGQRFLHGVGTWGLGGFVVGGMAQEIAGGDTGSQLAAAFQGAGTGAAIGSAIAPGMGTAIGAALGGAGGVLADALTEDGETWGDELAQDFLRGLRRRFPEIKRMFTEMDLGSESAYEPSGIPSLGIEPFPVKGERTGGSGLRGLRQELRQERDFAESRGASPEKIAAIQQQIRAVNAVIAQGVKSIHSYKANIDLLSSGMVVRMGDINAVTQRSMKEINRVWANNPPKWRQATAQALRGSVSAIAHGIDSGAIKAEAGMKRIKQILRRINLLEGNDPLRIAKGFSKGWAKAGDISGKNIKQIKRDLAQMPPAAQEKAQDAMVRMARALEKEGKLPKGAAKELQSALVTRFGETGRSAMRRFEKEGVVGAKRGLKGILRIFAGNDPMLISKAFTRSWDRSNGINEKQIKRAVKVLGGMRKPAREQARAAMEAMADELQKSGKIEGGARNLKSALASAFGDDAPRNVRGLSRALEQLNANSRGTFTKLEGGPKRYSEKLGKANTAQANFSRGATKATGTAGTAWERFADRFLTQSAQPFKGDVGSMSTTAKGAMTSMVELANDVLKGFGVEAADFGVSGKEQKRQAGGPIFTVPGTGSGDTFKTTLPIGSFVENREAARRLPLHFQSGGEVPVALEPGERVWLPPAVKAVGQGILERRNSEVPRFGFQKGGALGPEPRMTGPAGALRSVGQAAISEVYKGAKDYIDRHRPPEGGTFAGLGNAPAALREAMAMAQSKGLTITSTTGGEHAPNSWHYKGRAFDASNGTNTPQEREYAIAAAGKWGRHILELFYDPLGWYIKNGQKITGAIGGHSDHVHTAMQEGGLLLQKLAEGGFVDASATQKNVALSIARNLLPRGLNYKGAAGIIGNAWRESKWIKNSIGTGGRGLWGFDFYEQELLAEAERKGVPWYDLPFQTDFMWEGPEPASKLRGALNAKPNAAAAAEYFDSVWERSGVKAMSERKDGAREAMRLMLDAKLPGDASGSEDEHSFKEDIPAEFEGAKTGNLSLPPIPGNLPALEKEIGRWEKEARIYRKAKRKAEKKKRPGLAQAIGKNIGEIESHLRKLRNERTNLRAQKAKRKVRKQLAAKLGQFGDYEVHIDEIARDFTIANQDVEQLVSLEPQSPEFSPKATDEEREKGEKDYVDRFTKYVQGQERPAYEGLLGHLANWRNEILRAELYGWPVGGEQSGGVKSVWGKTTGIAGAIAPDIKTKPAVAKVQTRWEKKIREIADQIEFTNWLTADVADDIKDFKKDHPKATEADYPKWLKQRIAKRDQLRDQLPFLRFEDRELRGALGEARGFFFSGGEKRITPPALPMAGSGSLEDKLIEVQGTQWPKLHELLPAAALAPPRRVGGPSGEIWRVQEAMDDLGLKVSQAANSIAGDPPDNEGETERESILRELLTQANQEKLIREVEQRTLGSRDEYMQQFQLGGKALPPYAGKAHTGRIVPGPRTQERTMIVKGREGIFTEEQMKALGGGVAGVPSVTVNVYEDTGEVDVEYEDRLIEAKVNKMHRRATRNASRRRAGRQVRP